MDALKEAEGLILPIIRWLRLSLEAVGAFWIAVGFVFALVELTNAHLKRHISNFTKARLAFKPLPIGRARISACVGYTLHRCVADLG